MTRPAEPERRFHAYLVDRLLGWGTTALLVGVLVTRGVAPVTVLLAATGWVLLTWVALGVVLGLRGTSPGRALTHTRLRHAGTGAPVGVGPALLRSAVLGAAGAPTLGIGLATLAWTAVTDGSGRRRGWHDHLAGSVVLDVRREPSPAAPEPAARPQQLVNLTALRLAPATPTARWRVVLDTGERLLVDGTVLLGRHPEPRPDEPVRHLVPLPSSDMSLSKTHAELRLGEDGGLLVVDRGSTNGSVLLTAGVPRELVAGTPVALREGDRVRCGDRELTVGREC